MSPGNTFILSNYMMFLLQQQMFDQFNKVLPHCRRVMDKGEVTVIENMQKEFKAAIDGTEHQVLPEDNESRPGSKSVSFGSGPTLQVPGGGQKSAGSNRQSQP